jgi:hypothetical protein
MKASAFTFFDPARVFYPSTALLLILLVLVSVVPTQAADTVVFVPGNASGCFGNPVDKCVPLIAAVTVTKPGWITVTYNSGTVTDSYGVNTGPEGVLFANDGYAAQVPMQEAHGLSLGKEKNLDALIGVFVPQTITRQWKFQALDGTKNVARAGIMPTGLFFIGATKTFWAGRTGTLFLGINDYWVGDNAGGFNVTVSTN